MSKSYYEIMSEPDNKDERIKKLRAALEFYNDIRNWPYADVYGKPMQIAQETLIKDDEMKK